MIFVNPLLNSDTATASGDKLTFEYESTLLANGQGNGSPLQYGKTESLCHIPETNTTL